MQSLLFLAETNGNGDQEEPSWWVAMLLDWVEAFICWFVTLSLDMFDWFFSFIPSGWMPDLSGLGFWLGVLNHWFPLDWAVWFFLAWVAIGTVYIIVRLIWMAIPMTG